jgi:sulfite reductase (NADPH) flavoprotein alpha-component
MPIARTSVPGLDEGVAPMSSVAADAYPLNTDQTERLQSAISDLSQQQLQWVSGYAAGLAAAGNLQVTGPVPTDTQDVTSDGKQLTVLFGSQTGNGEEVAHSLVNKALSQGFTARAVSLADFKTNALKREDLLTFVISTHGEGDPPDDAELMHEYLLSEKAARLLQLKYSVLALGDSSYVNFCQTGREFDARLEALGAERIVPLVECDLDYEAPASGWEDQVIAQLPDLLKADDVPTVARLHAVDSSSVFNKRNPFPAEVLVNQRITGASSSKDVRHIELSIDGSGLTYEPGDSLAIVAQNPPLLVDELVEVLGLDPAAIVTVDDRSLQLQQALLEDREITAVSLGFLRHWADKAANAELTALLADDKREALSDFVKTHQIIDVVRRYPAKTDAQEFVSMLRRLSPRSYSIASSLAANPDEVHLTVAALNYEAFGRDHWGAASTHLADRIDVGDRVSVYVERNPRFRLPASNVPVIMIGPGTGVAPFRAFVEERVEHSASGDNWLIFGDRNFESDFLYQLEWLRHLKAGNLTRLDVAFSRDQQRKVYVQDRIRENSDELWRWLESGAVVYVCGDASAMANDVDAALRDVLVEHGAMDSAAAAQKLKQLRADGRYQRDVY